MNILIQVCTIVAGIGVAILLVIKIAELIISLVKFIKGIDREKIRAEKEQKEKDALAKLIASAQKKIDELNSKSKK